MRNEWERHGTPSEQHQKEWLRLMELRDGLSDGFKVTVRDVVPNDEPESGTVALTTDHLPIIRNLIKLHAALESAELGKTEHFEDKV